MLRTSVLRSVRIVLSSGALILMLVLAACEPRPSGGEGASASARKMQLGERVYRTYCATCHQADGRGVPGAFPPLRRTEWVLGDEGRLIRLVLDGMQGSVTVQGETYDGVMTPHGFLSDAQIAAVLTYVRQHFGNDAGAITAEAVTAVRAADDHDGLWTPEALEQATGIPGPDAATGRETPPSD